MHIMPDKLITSIREPYVVNRLFFAFSILVLSAAVFVQAAERPAKWAVPVQSRYLKNAYQLDAKVYRSAQPSEMGFKAIQRLGITDVLNLRDHHTDDAEAEGVGLTLHHIQTEADEINQQEIIKALRIIRSAKGPVLVHCWHGSDRTGAVCAMYRVVFNNWSKDDAINEMINGGFGYHKMYANIAQLIRDADVEKVKSAVFSP